VIRYRFVLALLFITVPLGRLDAAPDQTRPVTFAVTTGARFFNENLDLKTDVSFGARLGIEVSDRWGVLLDFLASHPVRESTQQLAPIDALRALARANILTGKVRPYAMAGIGGILFFFNDATHAAEGAVTFGGGVDFRIARRAVLYLEGSEDIYRVDGVIYNSSGVAAQIYPRRTESLGAISIGIGVEF
jgi:Outer membrane protein beta-barrel domain